MKKIHGGMDRDARNDDRSWAVTDVNWEGLIYGGYAGVLSEFWFDGIATSCSVLQHQPHLFQPVPAKH